MDFLTAIGACLIYTVACFCFGCLVLSLIARNYRELSITSFTTAFLLGVGVAAGGFQIVASFGLFTHAFVIAFVVLSIVLGARKALAIVQGIRLQLPAKLRRFLGISLAWKVIIVLIAFMFVRACALSFTPMEPLGDAVAFYLAFPKTIAETGFLRPIPLYELFVAFGLQAELHYAALFVLGNEAGARLFAVPVALAACIFLVVLARKTGLRWRGQLIAVAALCTSTAFNRYIGDGKTDTFSLAMGIAALYWALKLYDDAEQQYPQRLTAVFTGLAIMAKLSLLAVLPPAVLVLIMLPYLSNLKENRIGVAHLVPLGRILVVVGLWGALTIAPHVIKNAVVFGEPLAPLISSNSASAKALGQAADDEDTIRRALLGYPFFLTYAHAGNVDHVSVLALAFAPLALFLPRSFWNIRNKLLLLVLAGLAGLALWTAYQPVIFMTRYILVSLVPFILLSAYAADYILANNVSGIRLGGLITASTLIVLLIAHTDPFLRLTADIVQESIGYIQGTKDVCDFELSTNDRGCHVARIINEDADPGARIFLISPSRYWLRSDLILCSRTAAEWNELRLGVDPLARWSYFYDLGFEYLVANSASVLAGLSTSLPLNDMPPWLHAELLYEDGSYVAYKMVATDPPYQRGTSCKVSENGDWEVQVASP